MNHCFFFLSLAALLLSPLQAKAETQNEIIQKVGIDPKLGQSVPLDLTFITEEGLAVPLGKLLHNKPVLLVPVYYECPMLCSLLLNGLMDALKQMRLTVGKEFDIISFSINPKEDANLAQAKKMAYVNDYARPEAKEGWRFLTGTEENIAKLTEAIGFRFAYDPAIKEYAHASSVIVLTPQGKISHYFNDVVFDPTDLRLGLVEASHRKIATVFDQMLLLCFHYDPKTGKYSFFITNILRVLGTLTVLFLGGFILTSLRKDPSRSLKALRQTAAR